MPIDLDKLKTERTGLKARLRELEQEQRKLEAELKRFRQQELQTKRQIEALSTLIEVQEVTEETASSSQPAKAPAPSEG